MPITFPGLDFIARGEAVLTRGVLPGVHVVLCVPQTGVVLSPGDLVMDDGIGGTLTLPDCLPLQMSMRKVKLDGGWHWAIELLDHRWRWSASAIGGEWNKRLPDGSVDSLTQKTPAELATMCLDALGESGYDVSQIPSGVYPYMDWRSSPGADLALQQVCDAVVCEVCGGEFAAVTIYPAGSGPDMPSGNILHQSAIMQRLAPSAYLVIGSPKRYCTKLKLEPFGFESDNSVTGIDSLSYKPAGGWGVELPGVFAGLSAANRVLAKRGIWIVYEITAQENGSLAVPGSTITVNDVSQYLPLLPEQIASDSYTDDLQFPLPATVQGEFYNYGDVPTDEAADTLWLGGFTLDGARGRVTFPVPIFSFDTGHLPQAPTLTLLTSYHVTDENGEVEALLISSAAGGLSGPLFIRRPELFDANDQGTAKTHGTTEANAYIALYATKYIDNALSDQLYGGIPASGLSGIIAQITVMGSCLGDEGFTTRICRLEELAPLSPSAIERKRKLIVARIQQERGL